MGIRFLYLVRHGHYNAFENPDELGSGLSLMGKDQAFYAGRYFEQIPVTAVHASTMRRALETAEIIAHNFPKVQIEPSPDLWECVPTIPDRMKDTFAARYPDLTPQKIAEYRARADRVFERFFQTSGDSESHEVIITHGNLIRYLVCRALGVPPTVWGNMLLYHCGVTRFMIDAVEGIIMLSFNELGHIPRNYWSEL